MRRKSSNRTTNYRSASRSQDERVANFRQQMADFARGQKLKALREGQHLSQATAAFKIGVSEKTFREWEHGGPIKWSNAKRVARLFKVKPEELVSRELANMDGVTVEQINRIEARQLLILRLLIDHVAEDLAPELDAEIQRALQEGAPSSEELGESNGAGSR